MNQSHASGQIHRQRIEGAAKAAKAIGAKEAHVDRLHLGWVESRVTLAERVHVTYSTTWKESMIRLRCGPLGFKPISSWGRSRRSQRTMPRSSRPPERSQSQNQKCLPLTQNVNMNQLSQNQWSKQIPIGMVATHIIAIHICIIRVQILLDQLESEDRVAGWLSCSLAGVIGFKCQCWGHAIGGIWSKQSNAKSESGQQEPGGHMSVSDAVCLRHHKSDLYMVSRNYLLADW